MTKPLAERVREALRPVSALRIDWDFVGVQYAENVQALIRDLWAAIEQANCNSEADRELSAGAFERAYQMLEMYGVPRERARNVSNGIGVLVARMDKEIHALRSHIADLEVRLAVPLPDEITGMISFFKRCKGCALGDGILLENGACTKASAMLEALSRENAELKKQQGWGGPGPQGEG